MPKKVLPIDMIVASIPIKPMPAGPNSRASVLTFTSPINIVINDAPPITELDLSICFLDSLDNTIQLK
jgi:hypothetical protein